MPEDISLQVGLKGMDRAKQELQGLANAVDQEAEKLNQKAQGRKGKAGANTVEGFQQGFEKAFENTFSLRGLGRQAGRFIPQSIGVFNNAVAQAFDPNMSPAEKQLQIAHAGLDIVPFGGGAIPKAMLDAGTQEIIGGARGTGARINQILGPAFQAGAGLSDEEFARKFQPIIDNLRKVIEPQERSRERGSQLVAESLGSFVDEFKKKQQELAPGAKQSIDAQTKATKENTDAINGLREALKSMGFGGMANALPGKIN